MKEKKQKRKRKKVNEWFLTLLFFHRRTEGGDCIQCPGQFSCCGNYSCCDGILTLPPQIPALILLFLFIFV